MGRSDIRLGVEIGRNSVRMPFTFSVVLAPPPFLDDDGVVLVP